MGKVKGKHRLDKYYKLAKEHGYRSRASWKLAQLDTKHQFLHSAHAVLDLCAAPGGWMQVAVQRVPVGSLVVGVDLVPIAPVRGAFSIQQDITKPECTARLRKLIKENGCSAFDLVLHDGSPNVGGAWSSEATAQNALVVDAVKLATQLLAPKGTFITKIFRSQDYNAVYYCMKELFEKVEQDKPAASRSSSAETYLLGFKYKAPAKIDPRLLDVKHLFKSVEPQKKVVDVLRGTKQKRHRDGYEDGDTILRKVSSAAAFIWSDVPLDILGSTTSISFDDEASLLIKDHALTTEEVKTLCDDLRVLGKQDFKYLLKWRMQIKKALSLSQKTVASTPDVEKEENKEDKDDDEDKILNEMEELTYAMERKKKRAKKLLAKRRAQDKVRKATGMQIDALQDGYTDNELFSLASIKGKNDLVAVDSTEYDCENGDLGDDENEETHEKTQEASSSDMGTEDECRRYDAQMEDLFDKAYEQYTSKKEGSAKQRKRLKQAHSEDTQLLEEVDGSDIVVQSDYDSDKDQGIQESNPLLEALDEGDGPTQEEITNNWFSQDIFAEAVEQGDLENSGSEDEMQEKFPVLEKANEKIAIQNGKENNAIHNAQSKTENDRKLQASKADDDFEIVPAPGTDSSDDSSSDESEDMDIDKKAEILACAKKMLRKKPREQMLDDAYNKYMFDDDGLPRWFLDEEKRHRQPIKPVTKEEINAMKAQFKEIDARPAKKVAEAKARKKRVAFRKLEKVRKKANTISDQPDISDRSKRKQIEQMYKKAAPKRPQKEYVVAKKGVQVRVGKGKVRVDRRMKKDARGSGPGKRPGKGNSKKGKTAAKGERGGKGAGKGDRGKGLGKGKASGKPTGRKGRK